METSESFLMVQNSPWQKSLKCSICLELFKQPHTLRCGHSYCIQCLVHLACITRQQNQYGNISHMMIKCPTCRHLHLALPILKRKVSINYALQELTENWIRDTEMERKNSVITVRSISTQSDTPTHLMAMSRITPTHLNRETTSAMSVDNEGLFPSKSAKKSTNVHKCISDEEFGEIPARLNPSALSDTEMERSNNNEGMHSHATCAWCHGFEHETDENSTSEESEDEDPGVRNRVFIVETFTLAVQDLKDALFEMIHSPSRIIMSIVWAAYTVSVLIIANGFVPYMLLYSLLFILILYTETLEQRRNRRI